MAEGKGGDPEASGGGSHAFPFRVFLGAMATLAAIAAVAGAAYAAMAFRSARDARDEAARGGATAGGTCSGFEALDFITLLGTAPLEMSAYAPAGGPADADFLHYNVTVKVGANAAPTAVFRRERDDRNLQDLWVTTEFMDMSLRGYEKYGVVFNPDSIADVTEPAVVADRMKPAMVTLLRYEAGATTLFPAQWVALARGSAEGEYVVSLRTYRKSDPSHFQPHRVAHGGSRHVVYDPARPHFHDAYPLSERVSVAQEGDYPASGGKLVVANWGMEIYRMKWYMQFTSIVDRNRASLPDWA